MARARSPKTITVDAEVAVDLEEIINRIAIALGFRPTMSQTIRYLIANSKMANGEIIKP